MATMLTGTIAGFVTGNTTGCYGIAYNTRDKLTVGFAGTETIISRGMSYKLDIANVTKDEADFKFSAGSLLTKGARMVRRRY
jgi:hypothetical protein